MDQWMYWSSWVFNHWWISNGDGWMEQWWMCWTCYMGNKADDDHHRKSNINTRDHPVGQLTDGSVVDVLNLRENLDLDDLLLLVTVLGQADRRLASRVQPRCSGHTRAGKKGVMHCLGACHIYNLDIWKGGWREFLDQRTLSLHTQGRSYANLFGPDVH